MGGGAVIDVTGKFQGSPPVNPLSLLADPGSFTYVTEWLKLALEDDDFSLSPHQKQDMFEAVKLLAMYPRERWTLSLLIYTQNGPSGDADKKSGLVRQRVLSFLGTRRDCDSPARS